MDSFRYNPDFFGGTEYMGRGWHKHIAQYVPKFENYISIIIPGVSPHPDDIYKSDKELLVWMHNTPQQFGYDKLAILKDPRFVAKVKYFIVPSEEHKRLTLMEIPLDPKQIHVIPNALDPLTFDKSKFDNPSVIKLVHTSSAERGLDILVNAIPHIDANIRVEVYNDFYPDTQKEPIFMDSRIKFYGKTPKMTVREALENSHIHAYPSTYPETFCMSQVEAMSAGLACVTSDLGALPEVSGGFGYMYPYTGNKSNHVQLFAENLSKAINDICSGKFDPSAQIDYVNKTYSWEAIKNKWLEFHEII